MHHHGSKKAESHLVHTDVDYPAAIDHGDPNYSSEEEEGMPPSEHAPVRKYTALHLASITDEFLNSLDVKACIAAIEDLESSRPLDDLISRLLRASLDRGEKERDAVAGLIKELCSSGIASIRQCERAFEKIILSFDDLRLDVPGAAPLIAALVNRAVDDKCLPGNYKFRLPESMQIDQVTLTTLRAFKKKCRSMLEEFLAAQGPEKIAEVAEQLSCQVDGDSLRHEFVRMAMVVSMDKTDAEREAISILFASLEKVLCDEDLVLGFSRLLGCLDDLSIDIPHVNDLTVKFIVRAICDEILPQSFLEQTRRLRIGGVTGSAVAAKAQELLGAIGAGELRARSLAGSRLWGVCTAAKDDRWRKELSAAIIEFFDSHDAGEFLRILSEWEIDIDRAGEIVRKLIVAGMEKSGTECLLVIELLVRAEKEGWLPLYDIKEGVRQTEERLGDLRLDVPDVVEMLKGFKSQLRAKQLL